MHRIARGASREALVSQFLIIACPHESCGWVSMLPDFVGVTGRGNAMGLAMWRATKAAQQVLEVLVRLDQALPMPTDLASAKKMPLWVSADGLDWWTAVVRCVRLRDIAETGWHRGGPRQAPEPALLRGRRRRRSSGSIPGH